MENQSSTVNLSFRAKALLLVIVQFMRINGRPPQQKELWCDLGDPNAGVRGYGGEVNHWYIESGAVNQHPFGLSGWHMMYKDAEQLAARGLLLPRAKRYTDRTKQQARKRLEALRGKLNRTPDEDIEAQVLEASLTRRGMPWQATPAGVQFVKDHLSGDWRTW